MRGGVNALRVLQYFNIVKLVFNYIRHLKKDPFNAISYALIFMILGSIIAIKNNVNE